MGFGVEGCGLWVVGLGFRVQGLGFRVQGPGSRVQGLGFSVMVIVLGCGVYLSAAWMVSDCTSPAMPTSGTVVELYVPCADATPGITITEKGDSST